jgi:hypothetical protein
VALIVGVIGLASLQISRIETRAGVTTNDMAHAQLMAQSAIEYALGRLELDGSNWRTTFAHGDEVPLNTWIDLGNGQLKFILLDEDTDLADDDTDLVTIRGIGRAGGATSVAEITYAPAGTGFSCLEAVLHAAGQLTIDGATIQASGFLSSTTGVNGANGAVIHPNVETAGTVQGGTFNGTTTTGAIPREMPDSTAVFDYYLVNGTVINFNDIAGGTGVIDRVVLTKGNNPFGSGTTNSQGIYIIDCLGNDITIQNSRLEATLVLLNAGSGSSVDGSIHWEPAAANFPALMVAGNMTFSWEGDALLSEVVLGVNFNPPTAPYEANSDSDTGDTYSGVIKGLIYVSGSLGVDYINILDGAIVVGGSCDITASLNLTFRDIFLNNPPPGFADGTQMRIVPGTWTRAAN